MKNMVRFCQGVIYMKKFKNLLSKISSAIVCCLTIVLAINANSASCFLINEPKEPESIKRFKLFK